MAISVLMNVAVLCTVVYLYFLFSAAADPKGIELVLPSCCQDMEVVPLKSYYGGKEGDGKYIWYRTKEKLQESKLVNLATVSDDIFVVGETL